MLPPAPFCSSAPTAASHYLHALACLKKSSFHSSTDEKNTFKLNKSPQCPLIIYQFKWTVRESHLPLFPPALVQEQSVMPNSATRVGSETAFILSNKDDATQFSIMRWSLTHPVDGISTSGLALSPERHGLCFIPAL